MSGGAEIDHWIGAGRWHTYRDGIMTTTLRIDPKKKTFSMSAVARLLHYISHNDAAGVQTEISNGADVNHAEPVRRPVAIVGGSGD